MPNETGQILYLFNLSIFLKILYHNFKSATSYQALIIIGKICLQKEIKKIILDTLFPIQCLSCETDNVWICKECLNKINILSAQVCPYCEKVETSGGKICPHCRDKIFIKSKPVPLDNLIVATKYSEKNISHFIHLFKYRFISDLSDPLGKILVKAVARNNLPLPDIIIPVPLHKKRLRWRGFNQSELLANYISQNLAPGMEIPVSNAILVRKKYTKPQMKIKNYGERKKNMQEIFGINKNSGADIAGKNILLVDDVATTGATLFECGKALKAYGAEKIYTCVIARQEFDRS